MKRACWLFVGLALSWPALAAAQHVDHKPGPGEVEKLGTVEFKTSCSAAAQPRMNRAVALLHSFQFSGAVADFEQAQQVDPACAIAYWGVALSRWGNPFGVGLKAPAQLQQGGDAVARARKLTPKTERERAYIEAVARLYTDFENVSQRDRLLAYRNAMADVAARYPDDREASIFYALSLAASEEEIERGVREICAFADR